LLLPLRIGHARAYAMFPLGEPMEAPTALACGLANAVVPPGELKDFIACSGTQSLG
jgi:enoyl-CoA hydratase/carnithine racemase